MTLQQEEQQYGMMFGTQCCCCEKLDLNEIEESILEIQAMLSYAIDVSDQNEVRAWRRMLQQAKVQRRELITT